jgi:3-deoxy-D-manno-octulosonate 8-phosphate phosphatase (KDO 8-P phosphatase)
MARNRSGKPTLHRRRSAITASRWAAIRLFAMDVDGVLTDGSVYVSATGEEAKRFSVLDGLGLARLRDAGVALAWISGRNSGASTRRATELRVPHLIQGRTDKLAALSELAARLGLGPKDVCYIGDDEIEPGAMPEALRAADLVTTRSAGTGAVREVCDLIRRHRPAATEQAPSRQ